MIARVLSLAAVANVLFWICCARAQEPEHPAAPASDAAKTSASEGAEAQEGNHHNKEAKEPHAAEHHDPYDNSHKNATRLLTDPSEFKADAAIFSFLLFLLLLAILVKFAWKPIAHGLEARERGIAERIEQARMAAEQAAAQLQQYEAKLAAATAEAQQIVAQARQDADAAGQKLIAEAQAAAAKERERAVADITAAKNQALQEIAERSVDTAVTLARNIIRREVRPADHEQLIQDALKQFPAANVN